MRYDHENPEHRRLLASEILAALRAAGGKNRPCANPNAETQIAFRRGRLQVVCYTSIVGDAVRPVAKDAIRFAVLYLNKANEVRPLGKGESRVYRTGEIADIVGRVMRQWNETIAALDKCAASCCPKCRAPMAYSPKKKKAYCADLCWKVNG